MSKLWVYYLTIVAFLTTIDYTLINAMKLLRSVLIFIVTFLFVFVPQISAWTAADVPVAYSLFATVTPYPYQMAVDSSGNLYVAMTGDNKIFKYNSAGTLQTSFGTAFSGPTGVAITQSGNIIVANYQQDKVETWSNSGSFISTFGSTGSGNNQFSSPYAIAVDSSGNIYVADAGNNRVQKFDSNMTYQSTITGNGGAFNFPQVITIDSSDNLWVLDSGNNRVQKFNSSGAFQLTITGNGGAWNYPEAMTVDSSGNVYVGDSGNDHIQVFDSGGTFKQQIGSSGTSLGQYDYITGLGFNNSLGVMYVGDNTRIQKFTFDRSTPSTSITSFPSNQTTDTTPVITGTASDVSNITAVQYSLDNSTWNSCTATDGSFNSTSESFTCQITQTLNFVNYTVYVRATDSYTNTNSGGSVPNYTFSVANIPAPPAESTNAPPVTPAGYPVITSATLGSTFVTLNFVPSGGTFTGFDVTYGTTTGADMYGTGTTGDSTTRSVGIGDLAPNTTYYFKIRQMNDEVPGPFSPVFSAHTKTAGAGTGVILNPTASPISSPESEFGAPITFTSPNPEDLISKTEREAPQENAESGGTVLEKAVSAIANNKVLPPPVAQKISRQTANVVVPGAVAVSAAATVTTGNILFRTLTTLYSETSRAAKNLPWDLVRGLGQWAGSGIPIITFVKKRKGRGVVFNALTSHPIAGALVVFYSMSGNLKTDYTDINGRYFVDPRPDDYKVRAEHIQYAYPSKLVTTKTGSLYGMVYLQSELIKIREGEEFLSNVSLPMDPVKFTGGSKAFWGLWKDMVKAYDFVKIPTALIFLVITGIGATRPQSLFDLVAFFTILMYLGIQFLRAGVKEEVSAAIR